MTQNKLAETLKTVTDPAVHLEVLRILHDKDATQTAHGLKFKSTVPPSQIENLLEKLKYGYLNEGRGFCDSQISCVNIMTKSEAESAFDWSKAEVVEQRGNYSRY